MNIAEVYCDTHFDGMGVIYNDYIAKSVTETLIIYKYIYIVLMMKIKK